jgi:hypothetical protein
MRLIFVENAKTVKNAKVKMSSPILYAYKYPIHIHWLKGH